MPTVRCPEHGVFAYKTVACPGCAAKAAAARCKLAQDARSHWEKEIARVQREIAKKRRELAEQVRDAESCLDAHDRNVPEAPTGIGALFKQAAYDREYSDFLDRRNTLAARIADAKTQSAQYDERIKAGNIAADVMTGMIRDMPEATDAYQPYVSPSRRTAMPKIDSPKRSRVRDGRRLLLHYDCALLKVVAGSTLPSGLEIILPLNYKCPEDSDSSLLIAV